MSTALYRRYRPETFADVIGQEHVTEPLMQALRTGRVNHAYLFSGPRGCGKTTSARILARCLNCEQGPTATPCGECDSCVALARGGAGTVDVIEIDAASHGGVDDARDLRERASYGPAQSRYKIYIIDEAHMVTPQGFNALLKIVEEPPEHVKFVFATTEPEKVIGTIRSRTHHYPFRLVPPGQLTDYMERLCVAEEVAVAPGVLSFVVRAGGGSVRDSLSVLDQLIAGSGDEGLTYESAASLLGFTDGELLDATIDAFGAGDGIGAFSSIERVIETGLDPRRFIEDLLERLRDLIVVAAVPDGASAVLRALPPGPARADAPAGGRVRHRRALAGRRHRQRRAVRDDRGDRAPAPARAHRRAPAASRRRRGERVCRPPRPSRTSPRRRRGSRRRGSPPLLRRPSAPAGPQAPSAPVAPRRPVPAASQARPSRPVAGRPSCGTRRPGRPGSRRPADAAGRAAGRAAGAGARDRTVLPTRPSRRSTSRPSRTSRTTTGPEFRRARAAAPARSPQTQDAAGQQPAPASPRREPRRRTAGARAAPPAAQPRRAGEAPPGPRPSGPRRAASTPRRSAGPGPTSSPRSSSCAARRGPSSPSTRRSSTTTASGSSSASPRPGWPTPSAAARTRPTSSRPSSTSSASTPGSRGCPPTAPRSADPPACQTIDPNRPAPRREPASPTATRRSRPSGAGGQAAAGHGASRTAEASRAAEASRRHTSPSQPPTTQAEWGSSGDGRPPRPPGRPPDDPSVGRAGPVSPFARAKVAVAAEPDPDETPVADDSAISEDDEDIEGLGEIGVPVVERVLGGKVIHEEDA